MSKDDSSNNLTQEKMKRIFLVFVFIFFVILQAKAIETTSKSIAVFPVDVPTQGTNYSIYPMTTNLFCGDLVNELKVYNDFQPMDLSIKDEIINKSPLRPVIISETSINEDMNIIKAKTPIAQ